MYRLFYCDCLVQDEKTSSSKRLNADLARVMLGFKSRINRAVAIILLTQTCDF